MVARFLSSLPLPRSGGIHQPPAGGFGAALQGGGEVREGE